MRQLKTLLDKIPTAKLPGVVRDAIESLKAKVDEFFVATAKQTPPPKVERVKVGDVELPATTQMSVQDKLFRYLLDPNHVQGEPKAKWFREALGFTRENLNDLAKQIVFDPSKAVQTAATPNGTKYNQIINIVGSNGKRIDVNFGWIKNEDGVIRLTTAIPTKNK